jgi:hypothetical protein
LETSSGFTDDLKITLLYISRFRERKLLSSYINRWSYWCSIIIENISITHQFNASQSKQQEIRETILIPEATVIFWQSCINIFYISSIVFKLLFYVLIFWREEDCARYFVKHQSAIIHLFISYEKKDAGFLFFKIEKWKRIIFDLIWSIVRLNKGHFAFVRLYILFLSSSVTLG